MEKKHAGGRPSTYSEELATKICELIRSGVSERKIAQMDGMPSVVTIWSWKNKHPEFLKHSAQARRDSADMYADLALEGSLEVCELADQVLKGELNSPDGEPLKDLPRGVLEAKKIYIQEMRREAGIRDDSRFGDRKTVAIDTPTNTGSGNADFYKQFNEELEKAKKK